MIACGLTLLVSTILRRNCSGENRAPPPARLGAREPGNRSSGDGPEWHSRQSPIWRLTTIARPRAGSPGFPVSDVGMVSPTISNGSNCISPALGPLPANSHARMPAMIAAPTHSAENFGGDRPEPAIGDLCFCDAGRGGCIERTDATGARDLDELPIGRLVHAGDRDAVIGRHQAVAGVDQFRRHG